MMPRVFRFPVAIVAALLLVMGVISTWAPARASLQDEGLVTPEAIAPALPDGTLPRGASITLVQIATELADPVSVSNAGDGSGRVFVVERPGRVRIIDNTGALLPDPFLDISPLSQTAGYQMKVDFLEQGLLGLAFHPDYETNGLFYVSYSDYATNGGHSLVQYSVSAGDPNVADPDSAKLIMIVKNDPYVNHNGGTIHFGPDGFLYWAIGDGGLAGDPYDNAQNVRNPFGKILRLDVDNGGTNPYAIPADNPFATTGLDAARSFSGDVPDAAAYHPGAQREIWAYGLRNPWQFHFDSATGDLYITDVGQNAVEEINFQAAGSVGGTNYGWDFLEGSHCYPETVAKCPRSQVGQLPVAEFTHVDGNCSITGLGVSRTTESPTLDGVYLASDFCSGRVWGLARDSAGAWVFQELLRTNLLVSGGGNDEAGAVFLTSCNCGFGRTYDPYTESHGIVWRVVETAAIPEGATTVDPYAEPTPEATPATDDSAATPVADTGDGLTMNLVDIAFEPAEFSIAAGTDVVIDLTNTGVAEHTFTIEALGVDVKVAPGGTASVTINAAAGTYDYICTVPGHKELGMVGTLTVE